MTILQSGRVPLEYLPPKELLPIIKPHPEVPWPQELNLPEYLIDKNIEEGRGSKVAVFYENQEITYKELGNAINRLGNSLKDLGIRSGDRVLLRTLNTPEFIVSNFAIQKIGAITVPVMVLLKARSLAYIANQTAAKAIVVHSEFMTAVEHAMNSLETLSNIIVIDGKQDDQWEKGYLSYNELAQKGSEKLDPTIIDHNDVAVIHYTSGTTGVPKGCIHTPSTILGSTYFYGTDCLQISEDDRIGGFPTMAFTYGHGGLSIIPFLFGASSSLLDTFDSEKMLATVENHRITVLYGVPTAYRLMLEKIPKYDLSSLKKLVTASEAMEPSLFNSLKALLPRVEILEHLGCTEAFHAICSARPGKIKPGSFGIPAPGFTIKIFNESYEECPQGKEGHLVFRGPVGVRYWRSPDEQKKAVKKGWNYTGDIVYRDKDGFLFFTSRTLEIIKSAAYRISPYEIEKTITEHPAVFEAACIGAPDNIKGEIVKAIIVVNKGYDSTDELTEELKRFLEDRLEKFKVPREIEFIKELPRTETGKILRRKLKQRELKKLEK